MTSTRVDKIFITDFKRIKGAQYFDLKPITIFVGGNTSGKSSVLQAAQLCTSLMQSSFVRLKQNKNTEYRKTLSNDSILYKPTDVLLHLRHGEPATQDRSFTLGYECSEVDGLNVIATKKLTVAVSRGKNANLSLDFDGNLDLMATIGNRDKPFSVFNPGLSGIPLREEWRTRGVLDAAAMHGDANLYLRTLLDHLMRKDMPQIVVEAWSNGELEIEALPEKSAWRMFCTLLGECYTDAKIYIKHDNQKDRFINVSVSYLGQASPLDMASTGMLQVIQILAYACFYNPPLLLLDEPDAHLHADSQTKLHQALASIVKNTSTRIVLATHSPQLIQHMQDDTDVAIVWMDKGEKITVKQGQRPAIPILMELGALTIGADVFNSKYKTILLTEDKEVEPVKLFATANGAENFACLSYQGCGNLAGARQLAFLLSEIRPDAKIVIHRDRDFRTEEEMKFELELAKQFYKTENVTGVTEIFTPLNDVEHSFLQAEHLNFALGDKLKESIIAEVLSDSMALKRDDITSSIRKARQVIDRDIYQSERMKKKTSLRNAAGLSDKAPPEKDFLPENGKVALRLEQCHGKTIFRAFQKELHSKIKGDSKEIPSMLLKISESLKSPDWVKAFEKQQP